MKTAIWFCNLTLGNKDTLTISGTQNNQKQAESDFSKIIRYNYFAEKLYVKNSVTSAYSQ